ncbi:hypothetical protein APHAL10511_003741 [Amanita phalloides]|nr:hypothetical protein APHAL10511_003741 [Amanita phalloides]
MSRPCRYQYLPGGCRRSNCTFSHNTPGATSSDHRPRATPTNNPTSVVPKRVCKFFWSNGRCDKDSCRFEHTRQSESATRSSAPDALFPFLTDEGLAKVTGADTDSLSPKPADPLTPGEAHYRMKRFLADDFHFNKTFDVYSFFIPFNSAISTNPTWTHDDGQTFLTDVTRERSLLRMSEVLRWTEVSTLAGSSPQVLSFQRTWVPFLRFLSSDVVVKSTLHQHVNALYSIVMNDFESFSNTLITSMDEMISRQSFVDRLSPATKNLIGSQVFASISGVLFQCLTRFKNAISTHPQIVQTVRKLQAWLNAWVQGIKDEPPKFDNVFRDNIAARDHIISHLTAKVQSVVDIVDREEARNERLQKKVTPAPLGSSRNSTEGLAAMLNMSFDGPGELCSTGRRHDNDEVDIRDIRLAPTHEELICKAEPFLPANFYEAPHHLPLDSMERLFDVQFRLLREELTAPLRSSINHVRNDLMNKSPKTKLATILEKRGGKYRSFADAEDSVMFNVYTGVSFHSMTPDNRGLSVNISLDTPPGRARQVSGRARAIFWEQTSGKRLMQGGLVALVWSRNNGQVVDVHLGTVASSLKELAESARQRENKISSRVVFFDSTVELQILSVLKSPHKINGDQILLVEAPMMYEAIRPFLEALTVEPTTIPFQEYLVHRPQGFFGSCLVKAPHYATLPRFKYRLECLFDRGAREEGFELAMVVNDPDSVENARNELKRGSRLDPSQVDAVVCALTREVALIQGPPGTGKSYTGVELLRVLVTGHIRPILMIAFTNHALDHLLSSVLDAGITRNIVRLGSRSADERISQYSIENLERASDKSRLSRNFGANYHNLKSNQEKLISLVKDFSHRKIISSDITAYIQIQYPEHHEHISNPPSWITTLLSFWSHSKEEDGAAGWKTARKQGSRWSTDYTTYGSWLRGEDLEFLKTRPDLPTRNPPREKLAKNSPEISNTFNILSIDAVEDSDASDSSGDMRSESDSDSDSEQEADWQRLKFPRAKEPQRPTSPESSESDISTPYMTPDEAVLHLSDIQDPLTFFVEHSMNGIPEIPTTDRPLDDLLAQGSMWDLSLNERMRLDRFWRERTREDVFQSQLEEFENLRKKHEAFLELVNEGKNEIRRSLLQKVDIIGCTTTGAAKYASLLRGIGPKVLVIEEAGQVMEAHVLGNLVPSIEHLIMIGDPLQLRPTLNNYKLSVDSRRGSLLYKFDMSLMERLSKSGFPMSRIDIQRRMRPEISQLIRLALYPGLEDHDLVKQYPNVRGFARKVFFMTHEHRENDGNEEDSGSKYNTYEVQMIKDMVMYLLRQGCYSQDGDIVVLCAYLGQLARVRDALARDVAVVLDERDQEELADREAEDEFEEPRVEHIQVTKRVRLRTVDNYQGEEAKIVILSLVRNAGGYDDEDDGGHFRRTIGFLKSENRTNVALSRAKHGLFILGNAAQLASKSGMWSTVLDELQRAGNIGEGLPVACHRHSDIINYISEPGQLPRFAPDGGCLRPCEYRLKCGHVCPYKCHPDDTHHVAVVCSQPCRRLCIRGHPCSKQCSVECGQCLHPIPHVELPCGHVADSVPCYMMEDLGSFSCDVTVTKQLTSCEHTAELTCSTDVSEHRCSQPCNGIMECCGRNCNASCFGCQAENRMDGVGQIQRAIHLKHTCKKPLYCGHECTLHCSRDHECVTICHEACRQQCAHSSCSDYCSTPCEPCKEVCTWTCSHHVCPVPCGSVCTRLPCDRKCDKVLKCGHRCPSVCGEDCDIQICPTCAPPELQETVVDLILYLQLRDVLADEESLDNILITLPICRHVFTVETLDGICSIGEYYTKTEQERWLGLTTPEHAGERRKPPMCPTCRAAITSPRYGRVFKSANLDVLERNVISHMSNRMNKVQASWNQIIRAEMEHTLATEAKSVKPTIRSNEKVKKARKQARKAVLDQKDQRPVSVDDIIPNAKLFSISSQVVQVWKKVVRGLTKVYKDAADVCDIRSAHTNAWEAAFSFLYEQELDKAVADPAHAPRRPQEHAMRVARMSVGVPQPRADQRFLVEAIWATLQVRFTLVELAQTWIKAVEDSASYPPSERMEWGIYGVFLLSSCERDIEIAHEIAEKSGSRRQMTRTRLLSLRTELEKCRVNIEMTKQCGLWDQGQRLKYADRAKEEGVTAEQIIFETMKEHTRALRSDIPGGWLSENFYEPAKAIQEEWKNLEQTLKSDTFYAPVSLDEKMAIVKAFNFSHTGHFYACVNGHAFVITECGGAMEASRCPECGERIGGQGHTLDASNRRAEEFESLAHQAGSQRSPWAWGQ